MIIFRDRVTGEEVLCDAYKMGSEDEDFVITCKGKQVTQKLSSGINDSLIGGNPSQEQEAEAAADDAVQSGIDFVMAQKLVDQSGFFTSKKLVQSYLKKWVKNVAETLKDDENCCTKFKKECGTKLKAFLDKWDEDCTVYTGQKFDPEECKSSIFIAKWDDDGMGITAYAVKAGLIEEKC